MRIAVVLHVAASGGISRFAYALVDGLLSADPSAEITFFVQETLVELDALDQHFVDMPVEIVPIKDSAVADQPRQAEKPEGQKSLIWRVGRDVLKKWPALHRASIEAFSKSRSRLRGEKHWSMFSMPSDVVARLDSYDVVYLALPLWIEPFQTKAAVVGTFHDLNYRAFPENFSEADYRKWDSDFRYWSDRAEIAVTSTCFIKDELVAAFPAVGPKARVIYLAPYSVREVSAEQKDATLSRFGLDGVPFVLYPANITRHKNLKTYVEAAAVLRARMGSSAPKFVIAGIGTDSIAREATSVYVRSIQDVLHSAGLVLGRDVLALGYVSDAEIDALTQSAALLVSASLYEAGCGPAMDAWKSGVPVAFSNIAPFLEQIEVLGVDALTFDPLNPESIADAVERALLNPEAMREMAVRSERAISRYTWEGVGRQYLEAFAEAAKARSDASIGREQREPEPSDPML